MASSWQEGLIDLSFVREVVDLHQIGTIDASDKIWAFMMLELNRRALLGLRHDATAVQTRRASGALQGVLVPSA